MKKFILITLAAIFGLSLIIVGVLVVVIAIGVVNTPAQATHQATVQHDPAPTPAQPKAILKPQAQKIFSVANATHGRPHFGGLVSDFYGMYGKPQDGLDGIDNKDVNDKPTGTKHTAWSIDGGKLYGEYGVSADYTPDGKVFHVIVINESTDGKDWTKQDAIFHGIQFLPGDETVTAHNDTGDQTIMGYHTASEGDFTVIATVGGYVMSQDSN